MHKLKVSNNWLDWFQNENIELVTFIDNRELLIKRLKGEFNGNCLNYSTYFRLIDIFKYNFPFLKIENIRLVFSKNLAEDNLQFCRKSDNYNTWKKKILDGDYNINQDFEDSTDIYFNYFIDVVGIKESLLYKYDTSDSASIYLYYDQKVDTTFYKMDVELRKALFTFDENFDTHLPIDYINNNSRLLAKAETSLFDHIF